jgi:hypothetical protein
VHIPYETQVVLVPRSLAYGLPPLFYQFENLALYTRRVHRGPFREAADEFVEKFFSAYLKVECVAAILDANVEELCDGELCVDWSEGSASYIECEESYVLVPVVDIVDY